MKMLLWNPHCLCNFYQMVFSSVSTVVITGSKFSGSISNVFKFTNITHKLIHKVVGIIVKGALTNLILIIATIVKKDTTPQTIQFFLNLQC